jgi:hypothetical protein
MGRLKSAASRVAVPLAIRVTSQAASASVRLAFGDLQMGPHARLVGYALYHGLQAGMAGTTNWTAGCARRIRAAA